jgi:hypothetical protein
VTIHCQLPADLRDIPSGFSASFRATLTRHAVRRSLRGRVADQFSPEFSDNSEPISFDNPASSFAVSLSLRGVTASPVNFPSISMISSQARKRTLSDVAVCAKF